MTRPTRGRPPTTDKLKTVHFSALESEIEIFGGVKEMQKFLKTVTKIFLKTNKIKING